MNDISGNLVTWLAMKGKAKRQFYHQITWPVSLKTINVIQQRHVWFISTLTSFISLHISKYMYNVLHLLCQCSHFVLFTYHFVAQYIVLLNSLFIHHKICWVRFSFITGQTSLLNIQLSAPHYGIILKIYHCKQGVYMNLDG